MSFTTEQKYSFVVKGQSDRMKDWAKKQSSFYKDKKGEWQSKMCQFMLLKKG